MFVPDRLATAATGLAVSPPTGRVRDVAWRHRSRIGILRISDVATLERIRIQDDEIALHTLKTSGLPARTNSGRDEVSSEWHKSGTDRQEGVIR